MPTEVIKEDVWIPSTCQMCYNQCGIKIHRVDGIVVKIEGDPECPRAKGKICAKGNSGIMTLYNPYRLKSPLRRTNPEKGIGIDPKWQEISWDEALDSVSERLKKVREDDPRKLAILSFDMDFLQNLRGAFASAFGTNNVMAGPASYFCGNASHPISYMVNGAFHMDPDLDYCNYIILVGSQLGFLHGEAATLNTGKMSDARERGMKVVVVDPVCSTAASNANEWLPIVPGTDGAFCLSMLNVLINELGIFDVEFLKKYTNSPYLVGPDRHYVRDKTGKPLVWDAADGKAKTYDDSDVKDFAVEGSYQVNAVEVKPAFQLLKEHIKKYTPEEMENIVTIPAETIRRITKEYGEAARIGSTIVLKGKEMPWRPAVIYGRRGINAQKHCILSYWALELLNIVIGNVDIPGGSLGMNTVMLPGGEGNFSWEPLEGPDGMLVPNMIHIGGSHPQHNLVLSREVKPPESLDLLSLFPVTSVGGPLIQLATIYPEKFKLPYEPEVLIHTRCNLMMTSLNPKTVAEFLNKFSFIVSLSTELDETTEFADIVLPDTYYLERFDLYLSGEMNAHGVGLGDHCYQMRQPVIPPPANVRDFQEVLLDIAERVGFLKDVYHMLNVLLDLGEPYKLDLTEKYTWEEIIGIVGKSWFGPEHDHEWFKEHGFVKWTRRVEEVYPRVFIKPRIPVYLEHLIKAGEDVDKVTKELSITWDVSNYQPLPDWRPSPANEVNSPEYDLYAANYKLPFHTFSRTADNAWLQEMSEFHPYANKVLIHIETAREKGLKDDDLVWIQEATAGEKVQGRIKVTGGVHPKVVGIAGCFGHWADGLPVAKDKGIHFQRLFPTDFDNLWERIDTVGHTIDCSFKVKIFKAEEEQR